MSTIQNNINNNYFMSLALKQAHRMLGNTKTNPAVGCVLVKNNCVISSGHTSLGGRPHAEQNAINMYKNKISNSKLFVTLEPCSNYGVTPPCVNLIIKRKIKKVYFSINDPDIRSYNKCTYKFKNNRIVCKKGILNSKIKLFYRSYSKLKQNALPFVTAKLAASRDLYSVDKKNKWITNKFSRGRVHLMRSYHDCILTSSKSVRLDNSRLTCRIKGLEKTSPARIILDKSLKIPISSNIIKFSYKYPTIIFFNKFNKNKIKTLNKYNVKLIRFPLNKDGDFILKDILLKIKKRGFSRIFLEAGLDLTKNFLKHNLVDDLNLFISSKKLGKNGKNSIKKLIKLPFKNKIIHKINLLGDKLVTYRIK